MGALPVARLASACQHAGMSHPVDLRVLELLAARLCHELIGPVAAIGNGAELLADEEPDFVKDAVALVGESARKANRRLQFYRFAYGFTGGELAGLPPDRLGSALFEESAITCDYREGVRGLSVEWQKLACNMAAIGGEALPRGGSLVVDVAGGAPRLGGKGGGKGPGGADPGGIGARDAARRAELADGGRLFHGIAGRAAWPPDCGRRRTRALSAGTGAARLVGGRLDRVAQHIAAAPDGLDVMIAAGRLCQFLAQFAPKDVDDLALGLAHPAIEMVEEHLLGQRRALAQAQKLEDAVFLGGQVQRLIADRDDAAVEVDEELAGTDRRLGMPR